MTHHSVSRYVVSTHQDHEAESGYVCIYDRQLLAECGLPKTERNLSDTVPLRWHFQGSIHNPESFLALDRAKRWLQRCEAWWGRMPAVGTSHPQEVDWEKVQAHLSRASRAMEHREAVVHEHLV